MHAFRPSLVQIMASHLLFELLLSFRPLKTNFSDIYIKYKIFIQGNKFENVSKMGSFVLKSNSSISSTTLLSGIYLNHRHYKPKLFYMKLLPNLLPKSTHNELHQT